MDGAAKALTRLREEGVIRAWGLGVNLAEPCLRALTGPTRMSSCWPAATA